MDVPKRCGRYTEFGFREGTRDGEPAYGETNTRAVQVCMRYESPDDFEPSPDVELRRWVLLLLLLLLRLLLLLLLLLLPLAAFSCSSP